MQFILHLLVNAAIVFFMAKVMNTIVIKNYTSALLVALLVGILNATIGAILRLPMNILTLGLLTFFVRLIVTALMIKLADKFMKDFEVKGFMPALIIALVIAIVGSLVDGYTLYQ
jgi:putative membrane protein